MSSTGTEAAGALPPGLEAYLLSHRAVMAPVVDEEAGMTPADVAEVERLLDPDSAENVLDEPGQYAVMPVVLATGRGA